MSHIFVVAALVLAAWTLLALPLGVLIGRRLRRAGSAPLPHGCAHRSGGSGKGGDERLAEPDGDHGSGVPGCTARPCRALEAAPCGQPKGLPGGVRHGIGRRR